jgi:hypothetical protein
MRKIIFIILTLFLTIIAYFLFTKEIKNGVTIMDKYTRINVDSLVKTEFVWKDSKGDEYPVYIAHTGSCFVIKTSKSGEDYRAYLGEEVSEQIRKELSKSDTGRDRHCFKNRTLKQ